MTSSGSKTSTDAADGALVFLGLGANLGDRAATLRDALRRLRTHVSIDAVSPVYQSAPYGITDQPQFLNLAARGRTTLEPAELLLAVKRLEQELGRTPAPRMGPRVIDIDILLYGGLSLEQEGLTIPHADMLQRPFVLRPLLDIDDGLRHPVTGELLRDALARLDTPAGSLTRVANIGMEGAS